MILFGLTGGIASGKSTVAARFRERGVPVIDADQVARDVVAPGTEGLAAVRDAFGHVEHAAVVLSELHGIPLPVGRQLRTQVDDHVEQRSAGRPDDLGLRVRRRLEVHAAQRAAPVIEGEIALRHHRLDAMGAEFLRQPGHREEAALVMDRLDVDHPRARNARRRKAHAREAPPRV